MKKALLLLMMAGGASRLMAQAPAIQWQAVKGGSSAEKAISCRATSDGGYIASGYTASTNGDGVGNHGSTDCFVTKYTTTGTLSWKKVLGSSGYESAMCIRETSDGGYIFCAYSSVADGDVTTLHGGNDFWIVKLTSGGVISWQKSLGGTGVENPYSIAETFDGGYIVTGFSESTNGDVTGNHGGTDAWVVKLTSAGAISWAKCYGGTGNDYGYSIVQTADTGYMLIGSAHSSDGDVTVAYGNDDVWAVKLMSTGAISWQKSLGGSGWDWASSVAQTPDGGYIIAASSASSDGDLTGNKGSGDGWVIKLSATGGLEWQKNYGGSSDDEFRSVALTAGGGYIVSGTTTSADSDVTSNHGLGDAWVLKLSATGTIQWQKCYGSTASDENFDICVAADGSYCIAGSSAAADGDVTSFLGGVDFWVVKLQACTPSTATITATGTTLSTTSSFSTYQWIQDGAAIPGATMATYVATVNGDYRVLVTNGYGCADTSDVYSISDIPVAGLGSAAIGGGAAVVMPNPSTGVFTIQLPVAANAKADVMDMTGRIIATASGNNNILTFDMAGMPAGNYVARVVAGTQVWRTPIVIVR